MQLQASLATPAEYAYFMFNAQNLRDGDYRFWLSNFIMGVILAGGVLFAHKVTQGYLPAS
ncbi:MAG TPA: hypothetical protein VK249_16245 [Anaerolineales bacterium]|nr:hypothetical protein [Anaerolineales bacterium]